MAPSLYYLLFLSGSLQTTWPCIFRDLTVIWLQEFLFLPCVSGDLYAFVSVWKCISLPKFGDILARIHWEYFLCHWNRVLLLLCGCVSWCSKGHMWSAHRGIFYFIFMVIADKVFPFFYIVLSFRHSLLHMIHSDGESLLWAFGLLHFSTLASFKSRFCSAFLIIDLFSCPVLTCPSFKWFKRFKRIFFLWSHLHHPFEFFIWNFI